MSGSLTNSRSSRSFLAWSFVVLYALSGLTALAYEVLWARALSLQIGVSIFGVVVTVAAFMFGLGAGAIVGARWSRSIARPLIAFAILEGLIALFAFNFPALIQSTDIIVNSVTSGASLGQWYTVQAVAAILLLLLPALAMGLGFPLVLKVLEHTPVSLGKVYGLNALGGALGALLPLVLLPMIGMVAAVQLVALLSVFVCFSAVVLSFFMVPGVVDSARQHKEMAASATRQALSQFALLAYAAIGAGALILQIAWTRIFGMILLRTEYLMAVILAVFVGGIALGSLLVKNDAKEWWLAVLPAVTGLFSLLTLWALPWLAQWVGSAQFGSLSEAMFMQGGVVALLTLPVTLALGAWLPLLTSHIGGEGNETGAWLYGANAIGAGIGAIVAGFLLLPLLGAALTVSVAALLLFVCGMYWCRQRAVWVMLVVLLVLAWPVAQLPAVNILLPATLASSKDVERYEDAVSITHVVENPDGQRLLLGDLQRMDASSDPAAVVAQKNQVRMALLLHPAPTSVLFLGLGTGISAAASLPFPHLQRTGVELSFGAIQAAQHWFSPVNSGVMKQMRVIEDDARRFLRMDENHYDVIVGDLFHPDLVGRSALLSVQQFQRAKNHLNDGGIFIQWLALNQFDRKSLDVILRTFRRVFTDSVLFVDGFRLAMVGDKARAISADALLNNVARMDDVQRQQATGGEGAWTWLGRYWGKIPATQGVVQDEWAPQIEYQLPQARYKGELDLVSLLSHLVRSRPSVKKAAAQLRVPEAKMEAFERAYIGVDLAVRSWLASLNGRGAEAQRLVRIAYEANRDNRWVGFSLADAMWQSLPEVGARGMSQRQALNAILQIRPDHEHALRALWKLEARDGNRELAERYRSVLAEISPLARDVRDVAMGKRATASVPSVQ
ncbi:MAG: spermine synthase [Gammaproteobacteria bacterium]|nr:spermine synthase [Gammaproteobacteria bacterium]